MDMPESVRRCLEETGGIANLGSTLPRDEELEIQADIFQALSDTTRLKIVSILARVPSCVCVIKEITQTSDSKLSYHLNLLRDAGLVESRRDKNWIIYSLTQGGQEIAENLRLCDR